MSSPQTTTAALDAVAEAIRSHDRFLVTTHENPDGDALGSLLAMKLALDALGKDSVMYLAGDAPLPREYSWMPLEDLQRKVPDDAATRVLLALDCANESRLGPDPEVLHSAPLVVNVDHHHDNSRFGNVNVVVADASSTGEIVRDLMDELGVPLPPELAEAIYIALVTDTGRFQYANTTPKALRLAAELVEAGADVHRVFQGVYENVQFAKLKLLARALDRARVLEGGEIVVSYLLRGDFEAVGASEAHSEGVLGVLRAEVGERVVSSLLRGDFEAVGASEPYSEGIIDVLRSVEGALVSALIREPPRDGAPARKVSLPPSCDEGDVRAIGRKSGGGGQREAAGFSSDLPVEEITQFIVREVNAQLGTTVAR